MSNRRGHVKTALPTRPYWTALTEQAGTPLRIDREKGIIYGVRILGRLSDNDREYPEATQRAATPIYEGKPVRFNHPKSPNDAQPVESNFGVLRDVRYVPEETALRGDLHYNRKHPMAEMVLEDVERKLGTFGLSHNADGEGESNRDGIFIVRKITAVESIDLVSNPATNTNLWENRKGPAMKKKLSAIAESLKFPKGKAALWKKLVEDGDISPDAEVDTGTADTGGSPEDMLRQGFKAACQAVLDDDSLDMAGKLAKLKALMQAEEKLLAKGDAKEGDEGDKVGDGAKTEGKTCEDDADGDKKDDDKKTESRLSRVERENAAMRVCMTEGVQATPRLIEALAGMSDDKARKEFLAEHTGSRSLPNTGAPRSGAPITGGETKPLKESTVPTFKDNKERARFLRGAA